MEGTGWGVKGGVGGGTVDEEAVLRGARESPVGEGEGKEDPRPRGRDPAGEGQQGRSREGS